MDITVQELKEKLDKGEEVTIIDVREPYEYEEYNIGGDLIPIGELQNRLGDLDYNKDDEIIIHCKSGQRSGVAKQLMKAKGYKNVRNLLGGMKAWEKEETS